MGFRKRVLDFRAIFQVFLLLAAVVAPAGAQYVELAQVTQSTKGNVLASDAFFTADQEWVVFLAKIDDPVGPQQLYRVSRSGGAPEQLNETWPGDSVGGMKLLADGETVLYTSSRSDGTGYILRRSMDQERPVLLLQRTESFTLAGGYETPDGEWFIFEGFGPDGTRLYRMSLTGPGEELLLSRPLGGSTRPYHEMDSTGTYVVYRSDSELDGKVELYSVPISGGPEVRLNPTMADDRQVIDLRIVPDGSRVVYGSDQATQGRYELYGVPIGGGTAVLLNGPLASGNALAMGISPDSQLLLYTADETVGGQGLYRAPVIGGSSERLSAEGSFVDDALVTPDSSRVVYAQRAASRGSDHDLYSVPLAGGPPVDLGVSVNLFFSQNLLLTGDSSRLVLRGPAPEINGGTRYVSVPLTGGSPPSLLSFFGEHVERFGPMWTNADATRVAFQNDAARTIYYVSTAGGAPRRLSGNAREPEPLAFSSDGSQMFFVGGVLTEDGETYRDELFLATVLEFFQDGFELGDLSAWSSSLP